MSHVCSNIQDVGVAPPNLGEAAPDFFLPTHPTKWMALRPPAITQDETCEFMLGAAFVLYFYPKDNTKGCTQETQDFNLLCSDFAKINTRILGVSPDSVKSHARFSGSLGLQFPLLADVERVTLKAYGVWGEKKLYGRVYHGVIRSTFLIDGEGKIRRIWRDIKIKDHAQAVFVAAQELFNGL